MDEENYSLRDVNRRLRDVVRLTSDMVWEIDREHCLISISDNSIEHLGSHPSELVGTTIHDVWQITEGRSRGQLPEWNKPFRDVVAMRELADGGVRHFQLSGLPVFDDRDGSFVCIRGLAKDVTDLKETEKKLLEAKEEADEANRAKTDFLSSMSHELRTPLNSILGFGQLLADDPVHKLSDEQAEKLDYILKSGRHLLDLISDVLDFANIETGAIEVDIRAVGVAESLKESLQVITGMATARGIAVSSEIDDGLIMLADPVRLRQVSLNLLSNAVKYNKQGGSIFVRTTLVTPKRCRISVRDTGIGIPPEQQGDLFQPFSRLGAQNTEVEGTGIGLSISTSLVELMGGEIGFENNADEGATFWFELPLAAESGAGIQPVQRHPGAEAADVPAKAETATKLLYVEDNPLDLTLLEALVQQIDQVEMVSTHTAELGIGLALSELPDVIILDINLPGMDGFEVLKSLKSTQVTRRIPVIALSGDDMPAQVQRYIEAGFAEYLSKPIDQARLRSILTRLMPDQGV